MSFTFAWINFAKNCFVGDVSFMLSHGSPLRKAQAENFWSFSYDMRDSTPTSSRSDCTRRPFARTDSLWWISRWFCVGCYVALVATCVDVIFAKGRCRLSGRISWSAFVDTKYECEHPGLVKVMWDMTITSSWGTREQHGITTCNIGLRMTFG